MTMSHNHAECWDGLVTKIENLKIRSAAALKRGGYALAEDFSH